MLRILKQCVDRLLLFEVDVYVYLKFPFEERNVDNNVNQVFVDSAVGMPSKCTQSLSL